MLIAPGSTVGIVGGGQLGRMLAEASHRLGYRVAVLTGGPKDTPAGLVAETEIAAPFHDEQAIERFVDEADVITWEFESVATEWAAMARDAGVPVRPSTEVVRTAQDRLLEKQALDALGLPTAAWCAADSLRELVAAVETLGLPVIAKTARWGYDGKGHVRVDRIEDLTTAWTQLNGQRLVVESVVEFDREISVVVARGVTGEIADHGVMENVHDHHMLDTTIVPARVSTATAAAAAGIARSIVDGLGVIGVMGIEFFRVDGQLVVNELAPRPHNSGHCTIEAAAASQFEQQLRAITGLPLGDGRCRPAAMVQLRGELWAEGEPRWAEALSDPAVRLHLYGKTEPRAGRKMGHLTCVDDSADAALQRAVTGRERVKRQ